MCSRQRFLEAEGHGQDLKVEVHLDASRRQFGLLRPMTNSAARQHEHEYVNTTTRWDNCPLQVIDQSIVRSVLVSVSQGVSAACTARGSGPAETYKTFDNESELVCCSSCFERWCDNTSGRVQVTLGSMGCGFCVYVARELRTTKRTTRVHQDNDSEWLGCDTELPVGRTMIDNSNSHNADQTF